LTFKHAVTIIINNI